MNVDKDTLKKIAHLARLEIREEDEESLLNSLSEILTWVEKLKEVDTSGVDPLMNMSEEINSLRDDEVGDQLDRKRALGNAPKKDEKYFVVPKVKD